MTADDPRSLRPHYARVYSENGEDGYIAEIFRRVGGPAYGTHGTFVEIGVHDGLRNNTRFLLEQGWSGLWIEGDTAAAARAGTTFCDYLASGQLRLIVETATPDNINDLVSAHGRLPIDLLSLDIDQHTHCVWEALRAPAAVHCIEYNASLPPSLALCVPYDPQVVWDYTSYFGAGLKALEHIGRAKELNLVGCDSQGVNAFFVASALYAERFLEPFTAETHYQPPQYGPGGGGHPPSKIARRWIVAKPAAEPQDEPATPGEVVLPAQAFPALQPRRRGFRGLSA